MIEVSIIKTSMTLTMNLVLEQIRHLEDLVKCKSCKLRFYEYDGKDCGNCEDFYCYECLCCNIDLGYTEKTLEENGYCGVCMNEFDNETDDEYKSNDYDDDSEAIEIFIQEFMNDTGIQVILDRESDGDYLDYIDYPDTDDLLETIEI